MEVVARHNQEFLVGFSDDQCVREASDEYAA